ncbi:efflux RND transporter periplasmic adaptor subunit [Rhodomicrobium sp. Az07]|uniref:efflux RND transporter periplasmic adaptor subunit n=1 Tax=Rhodomicrobium sp. Az07 TaxID=2839034 RepID=UPI001BE75F41|nr:efflux RND transporter periplasmic adaptor subunit [Rhodomicrobium sp. Az07]MBT3070974.1 efflux RND transporter periplasmic adaptor subunit [Rhodomicrobium sp. Az07]
MNVIERQPEAGDIRAVLGVRRKRRSFRWLWFLLAAIALGGGYYAYFHGSGTSGPVYVTEPALKGDLTVTVTATGTVYPTNQVEVSSELSGIIRKVLVDHNDTVKAGQVVAELDTVTLNAMVERSKAALAAAKARVVQAEATALERSKHFDRQKALNASRFTSDTNLDFARADLGRAAATVDSAKADVRVAEAELKQNETALSKTKLYSPVDGVVLKRSVEPGQTVAASFQPPILFVIAENLKRVELRVDVDEADVGKVRVGQKATFTVEAYPGRRFPARIEQVRFASDTTNHVVTYKAILRADNPDFVLRPGMTATADIVVEEAQDALLIPNAALRFAPPPPPAKKRGGGFSLFKMPRMQSTTPVADTTTNERRVYVLEDGKPVALRIRVGPSDKAVTQVKAGLEAGTPVITDLADGPN